MSSPLAIIFQYLCVCLFDQYIQNKLSPKTQLKPKKVVIQERRSPMLHGVILEQAQCDISQFICLLNSTYFDAKMAK